MKFLLLFSVILARLSVTTGQEYCGRQTLDFDRFGEARGQYLDTDFYKNTLGIDYLACRSPKVGEARCRIFDTNNPVGRWTPNGSGPCNCGPYPAWPKRCWNWEACGDADLSSGVRNLDNVLIIDECQDYSDPPDDTDTGGTMIFSFAQPVTIHEIAFMDTEECKTPKVNFFKSNGRRVTRNGPKTRNNGYSNRSYTERSVTRLEITLFGSGAVASITFTGQECTSTTTAAPPVVVSGTLPTVTTTTTLGSPPPQNCNAFLWMRCFIANDDGTASSTSCKDHTHISGQDCDIDAVVVYSLSNWGSVNFHVDAAMGTLNGEEFEFTSLFDEFNPLASGQCAELNHPIVLDYCNPDENGEIVITGLIDASSTPMEGECEGLRRLAFVPSQTTTTTESSMTTTTESTTTAESTTTTEATTTTQSTTTQSTTSKLPIPNTGTLPTTASANGDPHIHRWNNERYSFQGECDLVLVHSDKFHGDGLDLHLRTTIKDYYSYIEAVALRLGHHILEFHKKSMFFDGLELKDEDLPISFGEKYSYSIDYRTELNRDKTRKKKFYIVQLGDQSAMELKFYRHFGSVEIAGHPDDFGDSVGLSGTFPTGDILGRDGRRMKKNDKFGFEWQVDPSIDPSLFSDLRGPQLPRETCRMPTVKKSNVKKLRGAVKALYKQAKKACHAQTGDDLEACIDDVLATGDAGLGQEWK